MSKQYDGVCQVQMGEGMIGVALCGGDDERGWGVSFMKNGTGEIGKVVEPSTEGKFDTDCDAVCRLMFTNVESVDVVMRSLQECRDLA